MGAGFYFDWVHYFVPLSGIGLGWFGAYMRWIRPMRREHEAKETLERNREKARNDIWDGVPARAGMPASDAVPPLVDRLVETIDGQRKLEARMDEANGTQLHILEEVASIRSDVAEIAGHWARIEPALTRIMGEAT